MQTDKRVLGKTGLAVSPLGLGAGGNSRLGLGLGQDEAHAADVVRSALDLGLNLIDTARVYDTEPAVGRALRGRRDGVVVSSKSPYQDENDELLSPAAFAQNLDSSLRDLGLEWIDLYFIHGLQPDLYEAARDRFLPVLQAARQAGKVRCVGLTEQFESDTRHAMLQRALADEGWDVFMVGYNLINPSARARILAPARQKGIATLGMFAVRRGLIDPGWLRQLLARMAQAGEIEPKLAAEPDLLAALGLADCCETLSEAAYRFAAFTPGMDSVLSGTSSPAHLAQNLAAVQRGPLPPAALARLEQLFGRVDSFSAQVKPLPKKRPFWVSIVDQVLANLTPKGKK